ncbi:MAG: hypothetical protein JXB03_02980 [Spirochaetales bacterium]|nr:hypothetical protein [Spirochaetales bacterium]
MIDRPRRSSENNGPLDEYLRCLDALIDARVFRRSKNSQKILKFYRKKLKEKSYDYISEKIIAFEVFKKDLQYDPTVDSFIRVVFYRFRNNLTEYYLDQGVNDTIELYIPKGAYVPFFRRRNTGLLPVSGSPFGSKDSSLEDRVLHNLRTLFMLTLAESDLDLACEYYASLPEDRKTAYAIAVSYELRLYRRIIFMDDAGPTVDTLEREVQKLLADNTAEEHSYVPAILLCILKGNYEGLKDYSETLYQITDMPFYKSIACMSNCLVDPEPGMMKELEAMLHSHSNLSFFWHMPKLLMYLRKGSMYEAISEAYEISRVKSLISDVLLVVIKNRLEKLSAEDRAFIADNRRYFSAEYLRCFLFEMASTYAIE